MGYVRIWDYLRNWPRNNKILGARLNEDLYGIAVGMPIACTAVYANVGVGQFTLTPINGLAVPATMAIGTQVRFVSPATADNGLIQAELVGVTSPSGMLTLVSGDGVTWAIFHDIQQDDIVTLEYTALGYWADVSPRMSRVQTMFPHGSVGVSAGGFKGTAGGHVVNFGPFDGGNFVVKDFTTGGFRMMHFASAGLSSNIFDGTSYVDGVLGVAPSNSFYFIYAFNPSSNPRDIAINLSATVPGQSTLGHRIMSTDDKYTYIGLAYTDAADVGFNGTGNNPQVLVHSIFNPTLLPGMTTGVTPVTGVGNTFTDLSDATIKDAIDAVTCLPVFNCICSFTNDTDNASVELRLKVAGISADGAGTQTPFTNYSDVFKATCHKATKYDQVSAQYGQALASGFVAVTPQVRNLTGSGTYEVSHLGYLWQ